MTETRPARWLIGLAVLLTVAALEIVGALAPLNRSLIDLRFRLLERPASGSLVIVQIDSRSLGELDVWPWPRRYHAEVLDRLLAAGVSEVAWDIDFSARSTEEDDRRFAEALARSDNRVVLAAFRQAASPEVAGGQLFDTRPMPMFSEHAQVGSVNVSPAGDGLVRALSSMETIAGEELPAAFALLAGPSAVVKRDFLLDFGIDPLTIPRLSYIDVLNGDFDPAAVAGRKVIVGATATELRDILPVPIYRSMAGSTLQAMAYESAVQDRALRSPGLLAELGVAVLVILLLVPYFAARSWYRAIVAGLFAAAALEAGATGLQAVTPIALSTGPGLIAILLCFLAAMSRRIEGQARKILAQRHGLARRRALLDRVVEDSFDGIVITDEEGRIQLFNESAQALLGWSPADVAGRPLDEILPGLFETLGHGLPDAKSARGAIRPRECSILRRDGTPLDVELVIGQVRLDSETREGSRGARTRLFRSLTFRDIAERKQAREAEKLAANRAIAADRAKTEFLTNMSHELRTPLNAIIGFSDIIRSEAFGPLEPRRYLDYIEDISSSGNHLLGIINDVLDVSRIELGEFRLNRERLDLRDVLRSCVTIASGWPAFKERTFESEVPDRLPAVQGDERVIKQVVINLLSNAFKYSGAGDEIHLSAAADQAGCVTIVVRDTGIGIDREHIPRLTKRFYQVDGALDRVYEGTGLGLYLASNFVKLHGGELGIESALGGGTTVTVRLPSLADDPKEVSVVVEDLAAVG